MAAVTSCETALFNKTVLDLAMLNTATMIPYSRASEKEVGIFNVQDCLNKFSYTDQTLHACSWSVPGTFTSATFYSQNTILGAFQSI